MISISIGVYLAVIVGFLVACFFCMYNTHRVYVEVRWLFSPVRNMCSIKIQPKEIFINIPYHLLALSGWVYVAVEAFKFLILAW